MTDMAAVWPGLPWRRGLGLGACWLLGGLFVAASMPKILWPHDFALAVYRYQLLPPSLVNLAAVGLPWVELTAALALMVVRPLRQAAAAIMAGLLLLFTAAMFVSLWRGINISCGCFSVAGEEGQIGWFSIGRNALLFGLAALCCRWAGRAQPGSESKEAAAP